MYKGSDTEYKTKIVGQADPGPSRKPKYDLSPKTVIQRVVVPGATPHNASYYLYPWL